MLSLSDPSWLGCHRIFAAQMFRSLLFLSKLPWEQETPLHNRWHPDIPPVASVVEGETFRVSYSLLVVLVSLIVTLHTTAKL